MAPRPGAGALGAARKENAMSEISERIERDFTYHAPKGILERWWPKPTEGAA